MWAAGQVLAKTVAILGKSAKRVGRDKTIIHDDNDNLSLSRGKKSGFPFLPVPLKNFNRPDVLVKQIFRGSDFLDLA